MHSALQYLVLAYGCALRCSRFRNSNHGTRVRSAWRAAADADALVMVLDAFRQVLHALGPIHTETLDHPVPSRERP